MDCSRLIKKISAFILILSLLSSCGLFKKISIKNTDNDTYDIMYARTLYITREQLDSICVVDTLEQDINKWYSTTFTDYPTNQNVTKKVFVKTNSKKQTFYILTMYNDEEKYKMIIRTEEDND